MSPHEQVALPRRPATDGFPLGSTVPASYRVRNMTVRAQSIGALAIGRLAVGRARIRRFEIDELVVHKLRVTDTMQTPRTAAAEH